MKIKKIIKIIFDRIYANKKINIRKGLIQRKPIVQLKNNIQIKIWDSATSASKELKISRGNIVSTLKGKRPRAGTFEWKYLY